MVNKMENKSLSPRGSGSTDFIQNWSCHELASYLRSKGHPELYIQSLTVDQQVDGKGALLLSEDDLKSPSIGIKTVGELKRLYFDILELQQQEYITNPRISSILTGHHYSSPSLHHRASHPSVLPGVGSSGGVEHPPFPPGSGAAQASTKKKHRRQVTFDQDSTSDESQLEELISAKILKKRRPLIQNDSSASEGESLVSGLLNLRHRKLSNLGAVPQAPTSGGGGGGTTSTHHPASTSNPEGNGGGSQSGGNVIGSPSHPGLDAASRRTSAASSSSTTAKPILKPEFSKALVAMGYVFIVTWITALVMVIVHDRVPDMEKYPPLPDLFLDNMPHIPWAFEMCEITGTILLSLWLGVLFFHKHRMILLRRFFALSGTVFLLRCFTMLITSLSVPGTHLKCNPRPYGDWKTRLYNAYLIWRGAGMSIQGVRTCGDYMFSGHTVALTMLNFFVTEYTTRRLYWIHTFSWLLNTFGIFFILAAHEHYSIDVFIAFYITSRLFLYYHTLANNSALLQRDSKRTKIWFPLFSFFESGVDGPVPNLYEWPITFRRIKILLRELIVVIETKWRGKFFNEGGFFRGRSFFIRPNTGGSPVDHGHVN